MNAEKYSELERRSSDELENLLSHQRTLAQQVIKSEVSQMIATGEAFALTGEEERMLRAFRRFKINCKPGAVFKWHTRPDPAGVVLAEDTGLVRDPQEVVAPGA